MNGHKQGGLEGGKNWLCIKLKFQIKVDQNKFFEHAYFNMSLTKEAQPLLLQQMGENWFNG